MKPWRSSSATSRLTVESFGATLAGISATGSRFGDAPASLRAPLRSWPFRPSRMVARSARRSIGVKVTLQAKSDQDAIDHPEIIGGKGTSSLCTGILDPKHYAVMGNPSNTHIFSSPLGRNSGGNLSRKPLHFNSRGTRGHARENHMVSVPSQLLPQLTFVLCYTARDFGAVRLLEKISSCDLLPA